MTLIILPQYGSVIMGTPVPVVVLLLYTQPIWTTIFSRFLLKEKITRLKILAMFIVLVGVVFIVNPLQIGSFGSLKGILVALIAGFFLSGWVTLGSVLGKKNYDPLTITFFSSIFVIVFLLISLPLMSVFVKDATITGLSFDLPMKMWVYLVLFQLVAGFVPQITYYKGVQKVSTTDAGIILLLEPVSASILAIIFLGQYLTINIIIGGFLILLANYLVIKEKD